MSGYGLIDMGKDAVSSVYSWILSLCCNVTCTTSSITINNRQLRVVRMLAEGGFSFVYLVEANQEKFAFKKVLCQLEEQSVQARWEIEVHKALVFQLHATHRPVSCPQNGAEEFNC